VKNAAVSFDWEDEQARGLLSRVVSAFVSPARIIAAASHALVERIRLCFVDQRDPWGNPWAPLADATLAHRRDQGRSGVSILRDTGQLFASLADGVDNDEAAIHLGFADRPASIHQWGGRAGRNHAVTIPARPMMPIRQDGTVDMPSDWRDELIDAMTANLGLPA
jgi:phage virion morphogenesis protein